ncbi:MAG: serine protein kinase RIO [Candidatus Methanomethylophilaceae archaeon]|nr:serine protein kinase RIO [Candidatus Methanomethylophilaceae archaeon]
MVEKDVYAYLEHRVEALRRTDKTGDERKVVDEVFDKQTLMTLYELMTAGMLESVEYPISTGKEGNVFLAKDPDGDEMALKIFRTSTSTFKRISRYIEGDPRFKGLSGSRRKVIYAWTGKEYRNLQRYYEAEVNVPEPIAHKNNCLLMEFLGENGVSAPKLKDAHMNDPDDIYEGVLAFIVDGYREARLVHGDLSEYNILLMDDEPILIDCGQAMTADFYNAAELLERDIRNVNRFFRLRGVKVTEQDEILEMVHEKEEEEE